MCIDLNNISQVKNIHMTSFMNDSIFHLIVNHKSLAQVKIVIIAQDNQFHVNIIHPTNIESIREKVSKVGIWIPVSEQNVKFMPIS